MKFSAKVLKFGQTLIDKVQILDHNSNEDLVYAGRTSSGTPVFINRYVAESDFVIGIGGIYPSQPAGFSGGAKIILGVCGINTIRYFHFRRQGVVRGGRIDNEFRKDVTEAAQIAGLKFIINNLVSEKREVIDIFAGNMQEF